MGTPLKSFKQFTEETTKEVAFTFGRFNPPTIGHLKLIEKVADVSRDYYIFVSQSNDKKKNPLKYSDKVKYMKEMFPQHSRRIVMNNRVKMPQDALEQLYRDGYTKVILVVGSDRVKAFEYLKKYNGIKGDGAFYDFPDGIEIISAGDRDPDSDDLVSAMSASRMRKAAEEANFREFEQGLPRSFKSTHDLFNDVRVGMGLKPINNFREHIKLASNSNIRELYVQEKILLVGSHATSLKTNEVIQVKERKSNYIVDTQSNKHFIVDLIPHA